MGKKSQQKLDFRKDYKYPIALYLKMDTNAKEPIPDNLG